MIEVGMSPAGATVAAMGNHDRLDQLVSRIAGGDRAAFRCLYAFMAMRVWRTVTEAPLRSGNAISVARATFVELWHSAGGAARYDARDWIAAVTDRRVSDRLRIVDGSCRQGGHLNQPHVIPGRRDLPTVADHDRHIDRELTALLGAGRATIRTSSGVFASIDHLDHAFASIAAATSEGTVGPGASATLQTLNARLSRVRWSGRCGQGMRRSGRAGTGFV